MCAIAGLIAKHGVLPADSDIELSGILSAMHHRGPDARGVALCSDGVLLGSNRLRITDAHNPAADMPMRSTDERYTIVFNGEIYNHNELRHELRSYPFRTQSDTETLLAAYQKWGTGALKKLEGMYAFCIYDKATNSSVIACDPTGQKPAYVYQDKNILVFASEIDPLIANPFRLKDLDLSGLAEFTAQRFILGTQTHIKQIHKIEPGTFMKIAPASIETHRFYQIPLGHQNDGNIGTASRSIERAVVQGCNDTFNLEVPHALLLSGGIDSTAVLALAAKKNLTLNTFSVGFRVTGQVLPGANSVFDEFTYSTAMAKRYGTHHKEIFLTDKDYCTYLDKWAQIAGEPLGSQEAPCLVKLFEEAGRKARVVFSGSGPDEMFDGYSYGKKLAGTNIVDVPVRYAEMFGWTGGTDLRRLMPNHDASAIAAEKYRDILNLYKDQALTALQAVQLIHMHGRLAVYEFKQMDLISMRHSVEARSPLADTRLVTAAFNFDPALKQLGEDEKGIYKLALGGIVPPEIQKRKKQGFPIPAEMWFSPSFEQRAQILFEPNAILSSSGLIDRAYMQELWKTPDPAIRNIFSRLYVAESVLRRQALLLAPANAARPAANNQAGIFTAEVPKL